MKKLMMIGISLFFAFIFFLLLWSEKGTNVTLKIKENSFIEGIRIVYGKDGDMVWTLTAKKADFTQDENIVELTDVAVLVKKNGMSVYTDKAKYDLLTQNFITEGEIRANGKDYTITTASIDYEASSGKLKTENPIKVEGKRFTVEGKGMTLDSNQRVRILNNVKATFYK